MTAAGSQLIIDTGREGNAVLPAGSELAQQLRKPFTVNRHRASAWGVSKALGSSGSTSAHPPKRI